MKRAYFSCFLSLSLICAGGSAGAELNASKYDAFAIDFEAIADMVIERMGLRERERVVFVGKPGRFDPLIKTLRKKVLERGSEDLGVISITKDQPPDWSTEFTRGLRGHSRDAMVGYFADVDLGVMLPGATPADEVYAAIQDVLKRGNGRTIHFHWAGAYSIDNQVLEMSPQIDAVYQTAILDTDYPALAHHQEAFVSAARGRKIRVTTPAGTDLEFEIGDRPVTLQNGDASAAAARRARNLIDREVEIPAGAVRVAPLEESVNGVIAFPDMQWNGQWVHGLKMQFRHGKIVAYTAATHQDSVDAELDSAGEAGRSFREFALGMNPLLAIPGEGEPWIPQYGYGSGIVRLSLGDNTELGGKVTGGYVRWNFFTDATVTVGDEVWVRNGQAVR